MADATYTDLFGDDLILHYSANGSLWQDTGGTIAAADGEIVKSWSPEADAQTTGLLTEATNGPTFRADYASSGYPALQFDGSNDTLDIAASGIPTNQRMFVLMSYTWIGSANTAWCRGNGGAWCRGFNSTSSAAVQDSGAGIIVASGLSSTRRVTAYVAGSGQTQVDSLGFSNGNRNNHMPATCSAHFTIGALNTGSKSQFGNFALHEILVIGPDCEWGQVLRGTKLLRSTWGLSDPNVTPSASGTGVSGFPLSRLVS